MSATGWLTALGCSMLAVGGRVGIRWASSGPAGASDDRRMSGAGWLAGAARIFGVGVPGAGAASVLAVGVVAAVAIAAFSAPGSVVLVVVAAEVAPWHRLRRLQGRTAEGSALIAGIEDLASRMAGGASLVQALALLPSATKGSATDLASVARQVERGAPLQESLDHWAARCGDADAILLADALALAGRTGASQAAALTRVVVTVRERSLLRGEVRVHAAQARASAIVLVVAPVGFAVLMAAADRSVRHVLVATPLGWACLVGGGTLDLLGAWWMRTTIRAVR